MIALSLALTFSIYDALKKNLTAPPVLSLLYETILLPVSYTHLDVYKRQVMGCMKDRWYAWRACLSMNGDVLFSPSPSTRRKSPWSFLYKKGSPLL